MIARVQTTCVASAVMSAAVPTVDVCSARLLPQFPAVEVDNQSVARLAAEHLLDRGFRNFAYCGVGGFNWSLQRGQHFSHLIGRAGYPCELFPTRGRVGGSSNQWRLDEASLRLWLKRLPRPVAIFASWDGRGLQVLEACSELGIGVPDEAAVLGVDDDDLLCELGNVPLSSVVCDPRTTGYQAARLLDRMMAGRKVSAKMHWIPARGVTLRKSTDVMATEDPIVSRAVQFIRHQACNRIGVADVLREARISRTLLDRQFKATLGRTIHAEILRCRIARAKELLETSPQPLKQVAALAGFRNTEYLTFVFKRECGITPSEHRRRHRCGL